MAAFARSPLSRRTLLGATTAAVLGLAAGPLAAQDFPSKPIRFVVPYAPGGTTAVLSAAVVFTSSYTSTRKLSPLVT